MPFLFLSLNMANLALPWGALSPLSPEGLCVFFQPCSYRWARVGQHPPCLSLRPPNRLPSP